MGNMSRRIAARLNRVSRSFEELNALHALRPIQDSVDLENAQEIADTLAVLPTRNKDQGDYLETLSTLIEKYEADQDAVETTDLTPIEVLRFLMEGRDMSASDLGRLLGNRELGAAILRGDRSLSKSHIQVLCRRVGVSSHLFQAVTK
jgi:antitoxin component HigA of HigAB toxin-antitoxin module